MLKRFLASALVLSLALGLTACGGGTEGSGETTSTPPAGSNDTSTTEPLDYPTRNVSVIVPKGAGGPTDTAARYLLEYASKYDENFSYTVENVTGANGITGMTQGALADPDGYTLSAIVVELAIMQNIASYNCAVSTDDFRCVTVNVCNPDMICVKAGAYEDIYDFVDQMDASTRIGNAGTYGIGDLATQAVAEGWGKEYTSVPYADGDTSALQALIADNPEIDAMVCAPSSALSSQVAAGNVEILCVIGDTPVEIAPDAPLVKDLDEGYALDLVINAWAALAVPKDTPDDIYNYLVDIFTQATEDEGYVTDVNATGSVASAINGEEAQAFLESEGAYYAEQLASAE